MLIIIIVSTCQGFIQDFLVCVCVCVWGGGGGEKFVGHCYSVMDEFAAHVLTKTIQIFRFSGGGGELRLGGQFQGPSLYETLHVCMYIAIQLASLHGS